MKGDPWQEGEKETALPWETPAEGETPYTENPGARQQNFLQATLG